MFYKHWNKIALALTGFFWASCDTDTTSANNVDEPAPNSSAAPLSSAIPTSSATAGNSSQAEESSSSLEPRYVPLYGVEYEKIVSSSSMHEVMPAYGVSNQVLCTEDKAGRKYDSSFTNTVLNCENGVTCQKKTTISGSGSLPCSEAEDPNGEMVSICPDYGVVLISENTYTCDDGNTYNEAQFQMLYKEITEEEPSDTLVTEVSVLYGTPESFKNMENQRK